MPENPFDPQPEKPFVWNPEPTGINISPREPSTKPVVEEAVEETPVLTPEGEKQVLLGKIQQALREHDGLESNVPHDHEYWDWCNRYRGLLAK